MAVLISHTEYKSRFEFLIINHGQYISSLEVPGLKNGKLAIFCCHLSGKPRGKLMHKDVLEKAMNHLMLIEKHTSCTCKSPTKIQIVSGDF